MEPGGRTDDALISEVLDEGRISSTYQPIVDLNRGVVVGFEAFVRADDASVGARDLFRAAARVGRTGELEAAALRAGLAARHGLVLDGFLSLNVSAAALSEPEVTAVLADQESLDGVVLEITDTAASSIVAAADAIAAQRSNGAAFAFGLETFSLDEMRAVFEIEPAFVKLDTKWIDGIANDTAKLALVETVCYLASRMGVRVVAQGIEALADLAAVQRLGVGFGQGFLLARPSATGMHNAPRQLTGSAVPHGRGTPEVGRFAEPADELRLDQLPSAPEADVARGTGFEVIVGELREPLALVRRSAGRVHSVPLTLVAASATLVNAARIALSRPTRSRFEPLVCVDELGSFAGVVPMERIVAALGDLADLERRQHGRHRR